MSKASQIKYVKCALCNRSVKLNGVGSDSSGFYKALRKVFQFTFFFTASALRPAADWHDLAVHQGPQNEDFEAFVKRVDDGFEQKCQEIANTYSFFPRLYLLGKAQDLRGMLAFNAGQNYPRTPCHKLAYERVGMDILSMLQKKSA